MAVATQIYAGIVAMTLTGASLVNFTSRQGTLVVNTTNKYLDAIISGNITLGATTGTGNAYLLLASSDATTVSFPAGASDASRGLLSSIRSVSRLGETTPLACVDGG